MNVRTIRKLLAPLFAVALSVGVAGCGASDDAATNANPGNSIEQPAAGQVTVTNAWIREPADGQTLAAGYGTITNDSDEAITLVGASAPVAGTLEIYETDVSDDGTMSMSEKDSGFEVAVGETFTLEPGGPHIMMLDIDPAAFTGPVDLTFVFDSTDVTVLAELRAIGDEMDAMDEDDG